jgi:hypothetical protein
MDSNQNPYVRVESLYGPGTIAAWLVTALSVLINWTFNPHTRRKDTISLDFVTVVLLPTVASIHLFFLLAHLPVSIAEALISQDEDVRQFVAAFEAPLNVCETFSMLALIFAVTSIISWCEPWPRYKRLGLIVAVGLLSWAPENLLYFLATRKGVSVSESILSRPYLFFASPIIASVWAFLSVCLVLAGGSYIIIWCLHRTKDQSQHQPNTSGMQDTPTYRFRNQNSTSGNLESAQRLEGAIQAQRRSDDASMRTIVFLTSVFLPLALLSSFFSISSITYPETRTQTESSDRRNIGIFFIPRSSQSISALDQAIALSTGCLVFLYTMFGVWRSRRLHNDPSTKRIIQRRRSI